MTNTLKYTAIAIACLSAVACDNIKEEDRFIEMPQVEAQRVVLLEEFTGQNCVNCPEAHELIAALEQAYPANVVAVSIHGGPMAIDEKEQDYGLKNEDSQAIYDMYSVFSIPCGVVDRIGGVQNRDKWETAIRGELARASYVDIDAKATLSADKSNIEISVSILPHHDYEAQLHAWVVESDIVARQLNGDKVERKYVHNNVLRKTVTGLDGRNVSLKNAEANEVALSQAVLEKWNPENLSVVVFLSNSQDGVLQAFKVRVETTNN